MLWIALHLPALSLEAWAATLPAEQAGRPLALVQAHRIHRPDARAREAGVREGMKRATALGLAPDLLLGQADARRDALALRSVAHVALGLSPSVAWATPPDWRPAGAEAQRAAEQGAPAQPAAGPALVGIRLEVQSCLRYWGGLEALLERLHQQLAPLGHRVRAACAPTALGAALLAAARHRPVIGAHSQPGRAGLLALQQRLDALPLSLLGLDAARLESLTAMGLLTLGDVAQLPRDGLARRLGPDLLARIDQARGRQNEASAWLQLPRRFDTRLELMARADTTEQVLAGARILLQRLVAWATARQVGIQRFVLVMHHEPRHRAESTTPERTELAIAPAQPETDAGHLHTLLAERLGRLPLAAPALELSLGCDAVVAAAPPSGELFASRRSQHEGVGRLLERLQARLGREQVLHLRPVADARPECGTAWHPAEPGAWAAVDGWREGAAGAHAAPARLVGSGTGDAAAVATAASPGPALSHALPPQPMWLLPEPQPLVERASGPCLQGRPLQLLAGPQRLETGWWDGAPAQRDYFIAQTTDGTLVWIFRTRLAAADGGGAAGWYLHGLFG